jgi:hypothetical protein
MAKVPLSRCNGTVARRMPRFSLECIVLDRQTMTKTKRPRRSGTKDESVQPGSMVKGQLGSQEICRSKGTSTISTDLVSLYLCLQTLRLQLSRAGLPASHATLEKLSHLLANRLNTTRAAGDIGGLASPALSHSLTTTRATRQNVRTHAGHH